MLFVSRLTKGCQPQPNLPRTTPTGIMAEQNGSQEDAWCVRILLPPPPFSARASGGRETPTAATPTLLPSRAGNLLARGSVTPITEIATALRLTRTPMGNQPAQLDKDQPDQRGEQHTPWPTVPATSTDRTPRSSGAVQSTIESSRRKLQKVVVNCSNGHHKAEQSVGVDHVEKTITAHRGIQ